MAENRLLITEYNGVLLSVLMGKDGRALQIETCEDDDFGCGNIFVGNVETIVPSMDGAFVAIGGEKGFLPMKYSSTPVFLNTSRTPGPLRQGDIILVQIKAQAMKTKLPRLTCEINISGFVSVFVYGMQAVRISSRIRNTDVRKRLEERFDTGNYKDGNFIIRTAAGNMACSAVEDEINRLYGIWKGILEAAKDKKQGMVFRARKTYMQNVCDFSGECSRIVTDNRLIYKELVNFFGSFPEELSKLSFYEDRKVPLGVTYNLEREVSGALSKYVNLKSGGFLVIEPAEALTVIDVNSGKNISSSSAERERLALNLEAAEEIARQLRLRNISGIIIVDFINLGRQANTDILMNEFSAMLKNDPVMTRLVDMTKLGLAEITRKKVRPPLYEVLHV